MRHVLAIRPLQRRRRVVLLVAVFAPLAASCSGSDVLPATTVAGDEQSVALADGVATLAEYQMAFGRFSNCVSLAGYPLINPRFNGATEMYEYSIPGQAVGNGVEQGCLDEFLDRVELAWLQNPNRRQDPNNQSSADVMRDCLSNAGIEAPEDATNEELIALLRSIGLDFLECIPTQP